MFRCSFHGDARTHQRNVETPCRLLWVLLVANEAQDTWTFSIKQQKNCSYLGMSMSDIDRFVCTAYKLLCSTMHSIIASSKIFLKYFEVSDMLSLLGCKSGLIGAARGESHFWTHLHLGFVILFEELWTWVYLLYHTDLKQEDGLRVICSIPFGSTLKTMFARQAWHSYLNPWASEGGSRGGLGSPGFSKFQQKRLFSWFWEGKNKFHHFCLP